MEVDTLLQLILLLLIFICSCVVILYNYRNPANQSHTQMATEHVDVLELAMETLDIEINSKKCTISYIEVKSEDESKPKLLLLHGQVFNATTWNNDTGTMSKLKEWGYRAVAVNLRDEHTSICTGSTPEGRGVLVHKIIEALKLNKVVLVSPSMSGMFSIPYIMEEAHQGEIAAYIPVAPVIDSKYKAGDFKKLEKLKAMIVQGENDHGIAPASLKLLRNIPDNKIVTIPDAGHPCYVNNPSVWHRELKVFLDTL